ncbi:MULTISPECIES: YhjD/YihY/BrkB family envelope integrity protein [Brevibacterium]|uniref:Inner membrane protein YhjD n=1 Tax=Brevibacterium salitolerans TaxID=1403566 RepID=A0ABP5HZA3_9MICO|nr:YhjD/YihY/BrkB family envelope integrity protein [Brevibacterium sp.]
MTVSGNPGERILTASKREAGQSTAQQIMRRPVVVHLRQTLDRYGQRLGNQFAAAITYFLVLALIPTLMFAFSALGFFLDVVRPELMDAVSAQIAEYGGDEQVVALLQSFLTGWRGASIVAVVSALYTAQGFIGNLKDAVRSQLDAHGVQKDQDGIVPRIVNNTVALLGILVGVALAIALNVVSSSLRSTIVTWLDLPGWMDPVFQIVPVIATAAACWLIFLLIFTLLPASPVPMRTKAMGALFGGLALTVLLRLATLLIDLFSGSPTAALFGPVIAIMLSMNVFARIILMVAAWMGTADDTPVFARIASVTDNGTARTAATGPAVRRESAGQTLGALLAAAGLIAATLLGFNRFQNRRSPRRRTP